MKKIIFTIIIFTNIIYANSLQIKLKEVLVIGNDTLVLSKVKSLAEDQEGNLYVPDSKINKVHKISPDGKLILSFGTKGVGPGDIKSLNNIFVSEKNEIVISELAYYVSFFDTKGKFIKKYILNQNGQNSIWYLKYIGNNHVIGKKFIIDNPFLMLVKLSEKPKIINNNLLKGDLIPVFNKQIRLYRNEFVPGLIYSNASKYTAIAKSNNYNIKILDNDGVVVNEIKRDIKKSLISKTERVYVIKNDIKPLKVAPMYKTGLKKLIPLEKNFINNISISNKYVFVERIKEDFTKLKTLVPIDVFKIDGEFLGQIELKSLPLLITKKHLYFLDNDKEENIIIKKYLFDMITSANYD